MDRLIDAKWLAQTFLAKKIIVIYNSEPAASCQSMSFFCLAMDTRWRIMFPGHLLPNQIAAKVPDPPNFHDRLGLFEHSM